MKNFARIYSNQIETINKQQIVEFHTIFPEMYIKLHNSNLLDNRIVSKRVISSYFLPTKSCCEYFQVVNLLPKQIQNFPGNDNNKLHLLYKTHKKMNRFRNI